MEQYVRDARINMIYEGTNTIQSLDLLGRKVLGDMGAKMKKFGKIVQDFVEQEGVKSGDAGSSSIRLRTSARSSRSSRWKSA